ncbi:hypothetical protein [Paenibacillus sp. PDC88]|uniref:hypothetical protein n=1 Tax=Paenibacillus sp. PDC88 TaxID=1884375 RepID=UPI00089729E3|nr:hypothetical protein [Paenibacillus sp. PDC88]SDX04464.1 hypothetical protein SAMN05518848_104173 [Paenibacillus sp. PDC88]
MENKVVFKITKETLLEIGVDPEIIKKNIPDLKVLNTQYTYPSKKSATRSYPDSSS